MSIEPDTKDWTWVLDTACDECGFVASRVAGPAEVAARIRLNAEVWALVLDGPAATRRPAPSVWSPTEYACHVRDVHRVFDERLRLMLEQDEPAFPNWDQDVTAVEEGYDQQRPADVGAALSARARAVADRYDTVRPDQLARRGRRSNGSEFTVETIGRYHLHDVVHHLWDVRRAVTVAAYDALAVDYREATAAATAAVGESVEVFAGMVGAGARVLEIGSGGGRDAVALERAGLSVRRTDVTPGFVSLLREAGHDADVLDPLTDDLDEPADGGPDDGYDGVWANASLLHVARADLPTVARRLAGATRPGGVLHMSVKEGDGEGWSTHGVLTGPRMFTYWRERPLCELLLAAGWDVELVTGSDGLRGERWLRVLARRD